VRIYDGKYLSVTSVIDLRQPFNPSSFEYWCIKEGYDPKLVNTTAKLLGSKVSDLIECKTQGLEWILGTPLDCVEKALYTAVNDFMKDNKVISCEEVVKNEKLNYAGRYDGIFEHNGEQFLADWKTWSAWRDVPYKRNSSKIKHVRWQLNMYAEAMGWKGRMCVVVFKNDGTWEKEIIKKDKEIIEWVEDNQDLICKTVQDAKE